MPTSTELRKYAKSFGFIDKMSALGFELGSSGFWFYRLREGYIDYVGFWISSSKNWVTIPVTCLKYDLVSHCDMDKFPKGFEKGMPFYSSTFINEEHGVEIGAEAWKIKNIVDIEASLEVLYGLVELSADVWLKNIDSNQKLYDSYCGRFKDSEKSKEIRELLGLN